MTAVIKPLITLGSDPELFLYDPQKGKFVSAIDKVGGTKYNPAPMDKDGFFIQEDNVLVEFNIPPADTEDAFVTNLVLGLGMIKKRLPGLELVAQASAFMPEEALQDPRCMIFGCDPDFNAWTDKRNKPPSNKQKESPLRSAGGHIAVGYELEDQTIDKRDVNRNIVQWADLYLGVPSILMDKDTERRKLYGKAGAFRHTSFGVEYRTLSSFWLGSQQLMRWAYRNTKKAVERASNSDFIDKNLGRRIQSCINNANQDVAKDICKEYDIALV
jgi:hypothetical protein